MLSSASVNKTYNNVMLLVLLVEEKNASLTLCMYSSWTVRDKCFPACYVTINLIYNLKIVEAKRKDSTQILCLYMDHILPPWGHGPTSLFDNKRVREDFTSSYFSEPMPVRIIRLYFWNVLVILSPQIANWREVALPKVLPGFNASWNSSSSCASLLIAMKIGQLAVLTRHQDGHDEN